jgi:hypothetical protein
MWAFEGGSVTHGDGVRADAGLGIVRSCEDYGTSGEVNHSLSDQT